MIMVSDKKKIIARGSLISAGIFFLALIFFITSFSYSLGKGRGRSESRRAIEVVGKIDDCIVQDGEPKLEVEFKEEYNNGYFIKVECENLY